MMLLPCAWCGPRDASEFAHIGEVSARPDPGTRPPRSGGTTCISAPTRAAGPPRPGTTGWAAAGTSGWSGTPRPTRSASARAAGAVPGRGSRPACASARRRCGCRAQPGEVINRGRAAGVHLERAALSAATPGDTIVSALAAAGERVFSRSMKYHRPRGLLTASFHDPGCMVQVGDEPNVRGAHRLAADGMAVTSQNTWPSLRLDAKAVNRLAGRFLTAGFYYKTFMRPRFAVAGLRERAAAVRQRRHGVTGHRARTARRSATLTPTCSSPAAARPGWRRPSAPPGRALACCWSRRSTPSAGTCAGAARPTWRRWRSWPARSPPSPAWRC